MAKKCLRIDFQNATGHRFQNEFLRPNGTITPEWFAANTITYQEGHVTDGYYYGCKAYFLVVDGILTSKWAVRPDPPIEDPGNPNCPAGTVGPAPKPIMYDCINGKCLPQNNYNTPGFYESLAACESICGFGCSGKCISNAEWAQIENLSNHLKVKNCS